MATLVAAIDARGAKLGAAVFDAAGNKIGRTAAQINTNVRKADKSVGRFGKTSAGLTRILGGLLVGFTAFSAVRQSVSIIAEFEESITLVGQVSGATASQLELLETTARQFGASTRFSASEAADGLLFLARAGFSVNESIDALPATLNLAQVGMIGLGEAADFASNIVAQFNLEASDTERVVDSLVIASNRTNTSVRQAAEAMKFAGTVLGGLNVEVEDAANLIGVLGDRGIQASSAGTGLRATFLKLTAPTVAGAKALESWGLSAEQVDFKTNDMVEVFERLKPALDDTRGAVDLFGIRNIAAAQTIIASTDRLRELREAQKEARGEAERIARALGQTLTGQFKSLISTIQEVVLVIGDSGLTGGLTDLVRGIRETVQFIFNLDEEMMSLSTNGTTVATSLALILGPALVSVTAKVAALTVALLANPLTAFPTILAAAGAALFVFRDRVVEVDGRFVTLGQVVEGVLNTIRSRSELVAAKVRLVWEQASFAILGTWAMVKDGFSRAFEEAQIAAIEADKVIRGTVFGTGETSAFDADIAVIRGQQVNRVREAKAELNALVVSLEEAEQAVRDLEREGGTLADTFDNELNQAAEKNRMTFEAAKIGLEANQKLLIGLFTGYSNVTKAQKENSAAQQEQLDLLASANPERERALDGLDRTLAQLQLEAELLGLSSDARRRALIERQLEAAAVNLTTEELKLYREELEKSIGNLEAVEAAARKNAESLRIQRQLNVQLSDSIRGGLADAIGGYEELEDIGKRVFEQLKQAAIQAAISGAFGAPGSTTLFGSLFAGGQAKGGAFGKGGRLLPGFEKGGVVSSPGFINSAEGIRPIAEREEEAIMPLKRMPGGRLGVESDGGGGGKKTLIMNIQGVTDADSFRRSERQISQRANRFFSRTGA